MLATKPKTKFVYGEIEKAKLKLLNLPKKERYALMEKRILGGYCPNCDIKLKWKGKRHVCVNCGFECDF